MRKTWILMIVTILCACASGGKASDASGIADLDSAIQIASREINDSLSAGTKVALLNFNSGSDVLSDYVLEEMSIALVKERKLTVVDRKEIDLIRGEMNFQMSGDVSDESAQEIGMMLGAQSIVSGSLVSMGDTYRFRTKAINVVSAAIQTSSSISVKDDPQVQYLLSQGKTSAPQPAVAQSGNQPKPDQGDVQALPIQAEPTQPAAPATQAEPALVAYKIGDTGPAGGLIFYDKGNNNNGWRYLEAAPAEVEFRTVWNVRDNLLENTRTEIGYGRRNTQLIVEKFKQTSGEWDTAAQQCDDLVYNGFDDWFLPSKDELDQMYGNLRRRNLGDFKNELYWSSSENNIGYASGQNFQNGSMSNPNKQQRYFVRPIRQVPGPVGAARSSADPEGGGITATTATNTKTAKSGRSAWGVLSSLAAILLIGGLVAFIIWGPSSSTSQAPGGLGAMA